MIRYIKFIGLLCFVLLSCNEIDEELITGNYYVKSFNYGGFEKDLSYKLSTGSFVGVIEPKISAVGYNDKHIIVRQQMLIADTNLLEEYRYYIIPIKRKVHHSPDENVIGPLNKNEFFVTRKKLKISENLLFTRFF